VVLPAPFGPSSATVSAGWISRLSFSIAATSAKRRVTPERLTTESLMLSFLTTVARGRRRAIVATVAAQTAAAASEWPQTGFGSPPSSRAEFRSSVSCFVMTVLLPSVD
jgi:hypothetical protein